MKTLHSKGIHLIKIDANKATVVAVSGGEKSLVIDGEYKYDPEDGILFIRPNIKGEVKLRVPKNIRLQIRIDHGSVRIADMDSGVRVHSASADVNVYRCRDVEISNGSGKSAVDSPSYRLRVTSDDGDIMLTGNAIRNSLVKSTSGDIHVLFTAVEQDAEIGLSTGTGSITTSSLSESSVIIVSTVGYITDKRLRPSDGILIRTMNGNIDFTVDKNA